MFEKGIRESEQFLKSKKLRKEDIVMQPKKFMICLLGFFFIYCLMAILGSSVYAASQVVVCNWGGNQAEVEKECWYDSFEKEMGIKVIMTSPPDVAKIKAQVDSGNIEWDLIITDIPAILTLTEGDRVYLEELDYSKLDPVMVSQVIPELRTKYYIGGRIYSFNICYNTKAFNKGNQPKSWADVWDVKKFPGVRSFNSPYGSITPQLEIFLMADGVPIDKLYPIDVERAWKSASKLKPHVTKWYKSHAEAIQLLVNGEVDISCTVGPG